MTRIISIDGNIGSGKSTFVTMLKEYFATKKSDISICFLQEPVDMWNEIKDKDGKTMIECFYSNPDKYSFAFQMMAYISRLSILKNEFKKGYDIIFTERCLFTDRNVFCKMLYDDGKIDDIEYQIYNRWFDEFISEFPEIEYIYIKTSPEVSDERIKERARKGETIPIEYLKKCHEYHEEWLDTNNKIIIDGNLSNKEKINREKWIEEIEKFISICIVTFDGASRGNPGLSGAGFVIWKGEEKIYEGSEFVSENATNNYAEYMAILLAIKKCNELKIKNIIIKGDSKLVIQQIQGNYKVNSTSLKSLYDIVTVEIEKLTYLKLIHIERALNKDADALANLAIDNWKKLKKESENAKTSVELN